MSAPNFQSMKDFPLIVAPPAPDCKICPECGETCGEDDAECPGCGASLQGVESMPDEWFVSDICDAMERFADRINATLRFHEVTVESGKYGGVQFLVSEEYYKIEDYDNEDARADFGMCRSAMLRKFKSEQNLIRGELEKAKKELGLWELGIAAQLSNGETFYTKVA